MSYRRRLSDVDLSADEFWAAPLEARYDAFRGCVPRRA